MKRLIWLWFLLLWLPTVAWGQTLAIQVPETSPPYTLIDAAATPGHNSYLWKVTQPGGQRSQQIRRTGPHGNEICFTGPPGRYLIEVISTSGDCQLMEAYTHTTITGEGPQPDPSPDPPPIEDVAAVVIVRESSTQTPAIARMLLSMEWRKYLDGLSIPWKIRDPDVTDQTGSVPSDLKEPFRAAKLTQGPDVCFIGLDGGVKCVPLPNTAAALLELLKGRVPP